MLIGRNIFLTIRQGDEFKLDFNGSISRNVCIIHAKMYACVYFLSIIHALMCLLLRLFGMFTAINVICEHISLMILLKQIFRKGNTETKVQMFF